MIYYMLGKKMALMSEPTPSKYCQIFNLPPQYIDKAIALSKVFDQAIDSDLKFNLFAAKIAAQNAQLSIKTVINSNISQHNGTINEMFDRFTNDLMSHFGMVLNPDLAQKASQVFISAFTDMSLEHDGAWIFWSRNEEKGTAYQYRTLYATISDAEGEMFLSITPLSLTVSVDIVTERVLCHASTTTHYHAVTEGLIVNEAVDRVLVSGDVREPVSAIQWWQEDFSISGKDVAAEDYEYVLTPFTTAGYKLSSILDVPRN